MKTKHLFLVALLLGVFSCNKDGASDSIALQPPKVAAYKIPIDSLKKQAVALGTVFGDPATKSRNVTAENAVPINSILSSKTMTKSYNTDPNLPQAYVINFSDNQGFAILVDDKRVGNNILAYSESGNIDQSTDNPGVLIFMDQATEYLKAETARIGGIPGGGIGPIDPPGVLPEDPFPAPYEPDYTKIPSDWGTTSGPYTYNWYFYVEAKQTIEKPKLLSVNWGQWSPYNRMLPIPMGGYYPTGCASTAAVQIMSYYQWPISVTVDGGTRNVNWTLAKNGDILGGNIHYLMHDVGLKIYTNYGQSESSANPENVPSMLKGYGYTCTDLVTYNKQYMISEINSNRAIYMIGYGYVKGVKKGHGWVVDGYKIIRDGYYNQITDYYKFTPTKYVQVGQTVSSFPSSYAEALYPHCNWGWDGQNNGYFKSFDTQDAQSFDNSDNPKTYDLTLANRMIYNIKH